MHKVSLTRVMMMRSLLLALLLLWPLLIFGRPAYMVDSAAYQNGGERAVTFVLRKLHLAKPHPRKVPAVAEGDKTVSAAAPAKEDGRDTKVARSILYSVLGYVFGGPGMSMVYMAVFHAVTVALVLVALFESIAGPGWRPFAAMAGFAAFASPLAPTVTFIMPDCYAPVMLGAMAILPFNWDRFSWAMRALIMGFAIFGVAVHTSHPPIALGTALAVSPLLLLIRRRLPVALPKALGILWAPPILGTLLVLLTGLVGFGHASVAPKHHPLALARAIDNGPARWYLVEECRNPHRYAICEIYGTHIPNTVQELLWSKDNLIVRATPRQLDRIRAEENAILLETTKRYPVQQLIVVVHDVPEQFIRFSLNYFRYGSTIVRSAKGDIILRNPGSGEDPALLYVLDRLTLITVIAGTLALLLWWRGMSPSQRWMVVIVVIGLLANAAVCAIFSGVAPRYQARLVWLVPWLALAIGFARGGLGMVRIGRKEKG
jgi:hypothetical protein